MYLVIDTSTHYGAVGLWSGGTLVRAHAWHSRSNHTAELMPAVEGVMGASRVTPKDLTGIAIAHGPGGFSALRAGLGVAKGLAFALGLPVVGVSTLEASAYAYRGVGLRICALIDAGREIVAWARFQQAADGWKRLTPDRITPLEAMLDSRGRHTLYCGEGAAKHAGAIGLALGGRAHVVDDAVPLPRLLGVAELGAARLDKGEADLIATLAPRYLRSPGITRPKAAAAVRKGG